MKSKILFMFALYASLTSGSVSARQHRVDGYNLVWFDEFEKDGLPNAQNWTYERGFVRNEELQWYQQENAFCKNGVLIIEARKELKTNPLYEKGSGDWRKKSENIEYTSACLITKGLRSFQYGRFEMRAKINISSGLWPAFWTLGEKGRWPANGEIDIMEYYRGKLLANIASLGINNKPKWFSEVKSTEELGGEKWASTFHIWRMDWDSEAISLYVDGSLLNKTSLSELHNDDGSGINPFRQKHYILIDLAMGGLNGGDLNDTKFPNQMEIDYVRVYQRK